MKKNGEMISGDEGYHNFEHPPDYIIFELKDNNETFRWFATQPCSHFIKNLHFLKRLLKVKICIFLKRLLKVKICIF